MIISDQILAVVKNETDIRVLITTSTACFFLILSVYLTLKRRRERILANQKIQGLYEDMIAEANQQKDIIYRNMHDHVNPMLRFVMRNMESHRLALKRKTLSPEAFEQDIDVLLMALNDIRSCTHGQVPEALKTRGIIASIENILRQRAGSMGIEIHFLNSTSFNDYIPFDELRQLDMYRISSELVENILRHSSCKQLEVLLSNTDQYLLICLRHDGKGITNEDVDRYMSKNQGVGLRSCRTRARLLKAEINYSYKQGLYTTELRVPFQWKPR